MPRSYEVEMVSGARRPRTMTQQENSNLVAIEIVRNIRCHMHACTESKGSRSTLGSLFVLSQQACLRARSSLAVPVIGGSLSRDPAGTAIRGVVFFGSVVFSGVSSVGACKLDKLVRWAEQIFTQSRNIFVWKAAMKQIYDLRNSTDSKTPRGTTLLPSRSAAGQPWQCLPVRPISLQSSPHSPHDLPWLSCHAYCPSFQKPTW
jgi:hypothetical protein